MRDVLVDLATGSVMGIAIWIAMPALLGTFGRSATRRSRGWLVGAIAAILVAYFLPSPWFEGNTETFSQHFVGGGVASALVSFYLMGPFRISKRLHRALVVLSVVSVLGVANELFELAVDVLFGTGAVEDASWDLFANTAGAATAFTVIEVALGRSGPSPPGPVGSNA